MTRAPSSPVPNAVYSYYQIAYMDLPDIPMLLFENGKEMCVIQISGSTDTELLRIPGFGESWWRYVTTTPEMVPVFEYATEVPGAPPELWNVDIRMFVNIDKSGRTATPKCMRM